MPQSAMPATRNEATSHVKLPDNDALRNLSHRHGNFLPPQSRSHTSQSATPATRREATQHMKHPKITPFATFQIGTAAFCHDGRARTIATACRRLRLLADSCRRLRTPKCRPANTPQPPGHQSVKREPFATHSGRTDGPRTMGMLCILSLLGSLNISEPWQAD